MNDLLYLVSIFSLFLMFSIYHTLKAFGLYSYTDTQKQQDYEEWLEKEGLFRSIAGSICIAIALAGLIYSIINFS